MTSTDAQPVLLGFGANLGDRQANIERGWQLLGAESEITSVRLSRLYETVPVGGPAGQPMYFNAAGIIHTTLPPLELLRVIHRIEAEGGRMRTVRWGARTLDIDILFYADVILQSSVLTIPHPEILRRRFVLEPAAEIAPDWIHPATQLTLRKYIEKVKGKIPNG